MYRYLFLLSVVSFLAACSNLLFVPLKSHPITPDAIELVHEDIYITTNDGLTLHGWKLLSDVPANGSILFFHGNGDNVSTQLPNTFWLPEAGYDVYIFDYREYGRSQGKAELDKIINDMEIMIARAVDELPADEKLIIVGHSLGASMAIYSLAHSSYRDRIKALVTVEAFSDYHDVTQDVLSRSWLFWLFQWPLSYTVDNTYRPLDSVGLISPVPLLILHSESDEMIDMYHAQRLYDAAKEPKSLQLIDSNHSNIFIKPENRKVLLDYLMELK